MQRTLILLKPDCVQRRLVGRVLSRFEDKGFNIIAMKMLQVTPELAKKHYAEHIDKPFYAGLEKFITGSPIVAAIIEGLEAMRVSPTGSSWKPPSLEGSSGASSSTASTIWSG